MSPLEAAEEHENMKNMKEEYGDEWSKSERAAHNEMIKLLEAAQSGGLEMIPFIYKILFIHIICKM